MDVKLPDGTVIKGVPDGISKADLITKLKSNGYDTSGLGGDEKPVAGSEPLTPGGMGFSALKSAAMFGPIGAAASIAGQAGDRVAHKAGYAVSQALAPHVPGEVAGGAGYLTNVATQAIPTVAGAGITRLAAPLLESGGKTLMRMALKPSTSLPAGKAEQAVNTMLTADVGNTVLGTKIPFPGANVNSEGIGQIHAKIKDLGNKVENILDNSTAMVNPSRVADALDKPIAKFGNQVNPESDLAAIRKVEDEFLKTYPNLIPIRQAHDLKQGTYKVLGDKAYKGELKAADVEGQKALAGGLRAETEAGAPAIAPLNAEQSNLINAVKAAISRDAVAGNKDPIGLGFLASNPVAAIGFMANRSELIKSLLARTLYSGAKPITTGAGATLGGLLGIDSGSKD